MKLKYLVLAALIAFIITQNVSSITLNSTNYTLIHGDLDAAGGNYSSTSYTLFAAVGEEVIGDYHSTSYHLRVGILSGLYNRTYNC